MSRKRLKDMLRKEMDERIKTYDTKPVEKPSLKFDLKTDLLGKTEVPPVSPQAPELKPILKQAEKVIEEPEKKTKEEEPLKRFNKYLEEDDDDDYSSSSESDYSESEHSDDAEDIYKQYKNKVNKIDEKINFRKVEKQDENKVKKDIDRRKVSKGAESDEAGKEDERNRKILDEPRRRDDRDEPRRRDDRDEPRRRDDRDEPRRRDDRDEPRRRDDRDEPRRRDDRDEPRRRDDRDEPRRRDDRDEPRRRDDRDEPRRRDELPSREVPKRNQFLDLPKRYILQTIKNRDVDTISADCVDEIKDILQDFTSHMFELFSEGDKVVIAERDDVKAYIGLFIEDEDKEMVNDLILPSKDIELAINNISDTYNVKIKKDVIYIVHMFLESILAKVIDGAKLINEMCKTKRLSGKEIKTAYKIYML
jgi:hypothetical protein